MVLMKAHERHGRHHKGAGSGGALAFAKKYPGFVIASVLAVFVIIIFFASSLMTGYSPTSEQVSLSKDLYAQNQQQLDDLAASADAQLNGDYQSTLEDDYFASVKDDFKWLKAEETTLYYARPAQDAYPKELAFTIFMQKIVQVNEDSAYLLDSDNLDTAIAAAQNVSVPVVKDLNTLEDFFGAEVAQEDYDALTADSPYVEAKFLSTLNALIADYRSAKMLIIEGSSSKERKYVEAKKLLMLS